MKIKNKSGDDINFEGVSIDAWETIEVSDEMGKKILDSFESTEEVGKVAIKEEKIEEPKQEEQVIVEEKPKRRGRKPKVEKTN